MTLILAAIQQHQVVMVSDQRLSWHGKLVEDNFCKTGHLVTDCGSAVYAFSGLVRERHFELSEFIGDTLYRAPAHSTIEECLELLRSKLTHKFDFNAWLRRLPQHEKALTIAFAGFDIAAYPNVWIVSNHEGIYSDPGVVTDDFRVEKLPLRPGTRAASATYMFGNRVAVPQQQVLELNDLTRAGSNAIAIKNKSAEIIRLAAIDPLTNGTVSSNLMAVTLPRSVPPFSPKLSSHYMSPIAGDKIYTADQILISSQNFLIRGSTISADGNITNPHISHALPCPCGSGRQYRYCHGRKGRR